MAEQMSEAPLTAAGLRLARLRFVLAAREDAVLPSRLGSTLRGGFGSSLKRLACSNPTAKTCRVCIVREQCSYAYLFETAPPGSSEVLRLNESVPRPFVIEPPPRVPSMLPEGERLAFDVCLVGRGMNHLPFFVLAFQHLGDAGIGPRRARFSLLEVTRPAAEDDESARVYDAASGSLKRIEPTLTWSDVAAEAQGLPTDGCTLQFLSATRLKHAGEFVRRPDFHVLVRGLLRRLSSLLYFHCGERLNADYSGLIERAKKVRVRRADVHWENWLRYSRRQGRAMDLGGFTGTITYEGDIAAFRELLLVGQHIHVGKGCVFGLGRYRLTASADRAEEGRP
ncbi:MAG: CRISPR system precrRNA processing endoribonuclease RAMP protein Cas6 [Armatimonadota bacterium]